MFDYFELSPDGGRYRWQLKKADDTPIANAVRHHASKTEAMNELALVRRLVRTATFEKFPEGPRRFGWRLKNADGVPLAISASRFSTSARVMSDSEQMRAIAPIAVLRDRTATHDIYPLGDLPSELMAEWRRLTSPEVRPPWPKPPAILQTRTITSSEPLDQPNTRYQIRANLPQINIRVSDLEVRVGSGFQVERVFIERGVRRVKFTGGNYQKIVFALPYNPSDYVVNNDWVIEDILFDGLSVDSLKYYARDDNDDGYAFNVRGRRVAIVQCYARSRDYCVWAGQDSFTSEDLILAGNKFEGICGQATVRLYPVNRAVVVENLLSSVARHNFRVHGPSRLVYAARNTLINGGVMLIDHAMPPHPDQPWVMDDHDQIWLVDNTFQQRRAEMLDVGRPDNLGPGLRNFTFIGNRITSMHEMHRGQLTNLEAHPPETWAVQDNHIEVVTV